MYRPRLRTAALAAAVAVGLVTMALPAYAHVTVNPDRATQGSYAKLTFRVPTEKDNASTTKLQVFFPGNAPIASVSVKPHPGWSYHVLTKRLANPVHTAQGDITEAVSEIDWQADSAASAIKPGEFDEFDISLGPLPTVSSMEFKTLQTYSDGEVVRWIQSSTQAAEPEHPAPVLTLLPAGADQGADPTGSQSAGGGSLAAWALGVAVAALLVAGGAAALCLRRRPS